MNSQVVIRFNLPETLDDLMFDAVAHYNRDADERIVCLNGCPRYLLSLILDVYMRSRCVHLDGLDEDCDDFELLDKVQAQIDLMIGWTVIEAMSDQFDLNCESTDGAMVLH